MRDRVIGILPGLIIHYKTLSLFFSLPIIACLMCLWRAEGWRRGLVFLCTSVLVFELGGGGGGFTVGFFGRKGSGRCGGLLCFLVLMGLVYADFFFSLSLALLLCLGGIEGWGRRAGLGWSERGRDG
ncbi:hypothetical protein F4861DRAFT_499962 [Xylaria intraflava]|nr:hypothetical protein F4861DRAFT_499962 [Xylaria intraflava]